MADLPLATWPPATDDDFKRACVALRIDPNMDTGRMGTFVALARLQERVLALEAKLTLHESKYGPREG